MATSQINVDDQAREKVAEVENLLKSSADISISSINSSISMMKRIVTAAELHRTNDKKSSDDRQEDSRRDTDESIYADYANDNEQFNAHDLNEQLTTNSVKWTIRVQAFKLIHRLVTILASKPASAKSPLLQHLSDLIRLSFVAATSPFDDLKVQGFEMFKFLINKLASVEESELPGHSILEQYRTQVISALKPAFEPDAPPYITAIATQVCCLWICRRLERDNLQRIFTLMEMTIGKLNQQSVNHNNKLYTESELEQERLDILGSWAQLYFTAQESKLPSDNTFKDLVEPHIDSLEGKWWEALKDYALLILPKPKVQSKIHEDGHVYTREVALSLFEPVWPKLILAVTTRLCSKKTCSDIKSEEAGNYKAQVSTTARYTRFICSIIMKELCRSLSDPLVQYKLSESIILSLKSLAILVKHHQTGSSIIERLSMTQEFYAILYKLLLLTKGKAQQALMIGLLEQIFTLVVNKMSYMEEDLTQGVHMVVDYLKRNPAEEKHLTKTLVAINNLDLLLKAHPNSQQLRESLREDLAQICLNLLDESGKSSIGTSQELDILALARTSLSNELFKPHKITVQPVLKPTARPETKTSRKAPKINLKTDFSNFYTGPAKR